MRTILLLLVTGSIAFSQPAQNSTEDKNVSLDERFKEMKSGSQTFKDYKVIKEVVLDKVWKITSDSLKKKEKDLIDARSEIAFQHEEIEAARNSMQVQQASINEIVFDSTHITVLGIPFSKGFFLFLTAAVIGGLAFVLSFYFGRVKLLNGQLTEKDLIAHSISNEFEDFKKKSMEKQTKLSRELQNERNKWMETHKGL